MKKYIQPQMQIHNIARHAFLDNLSGTEGEDHAWGEVKEETPQSGDDMWNLYDSPSK